MRKITFLLLLPLVAITGCLPYEQALGTAIAQTQAAATQTQIALPTLPPFPTSTLTPSATPIATLFHSPTPSATSSPSSTPDLRVIDINPRKLVFEHSDLPREGQYFVSDGGPHPITNTDVVAEWTAEEGQKYLNETGRIYGWYVDYQRGATNVNLPEEVYHNIVITSNTEGAQTILTKYSDAQVQDGYKEVFPPKIGDVSRAWQKSEKGASGGTKVWFVIEFTYRNIYNRILFYGRDEDVSIEFASYVAKKLLYGLQALPLSDTVRFRP